MIIDPDCFLVTADVSSLYTNIPIEDCIIAVDLLCRTNNCPLTALVTQLTRFVLTDNYFEALGDIYHQRWGLAMGEGYSTQFVCVCVCACVSESVISLTATPLMHRYKVRYESNANALLKVFDSWILLKILCSKITALSAHLNEL